MITSITFGPVPPPGRYSSGSRGTLSAKPAHPAAPSRVAPAPAAFKKSLRVNSLFGFLLTPGRPSHRSPKPALYQLVSRSACQQGLQLVGFALVRNCMITSAVCNVGESKSYPSYQYELVRHLPT